MTATVSITVAGHPEPRLLTSLFGWLDRNHELRRNATITPVTDVAAPGRQNAIDIIELVLSNSLAAGSLLLAFRSWRKDRPASPPVTITVNGVSFTVRDASPESLAALEAALREAFPGEDGGAGDDGAGDDDGAA